LRVKPQQALKVHDRALRNCPWSLALWQVGGMRMLLGLVPYLPLCLLSLFSLQEKLLALEIAEKPYDVVKQTFEAALAVGFAGASKLGLKFLVLCPADDAFANLSFIYSRRLRGAVDELLELPFSARRFKGWCDCGLGVTTLCFTTSPLPNSLTSKMASSFPKKLRQAKSRRQKLATVSG
jgi:hypothetical protein